MAVISGVNLGIQAGAAVESAVSEWKIFDRDMPPRYAASNTKDGWARDGGNTDWRGFLTGYGHTPLLFPADTFSLIGSVDGTNGVTGSAICDRVIITADILRGQKVAYRVDFSADGALSYGAAAADDTSNVTAVTSVGRTVWLDGTPEDQVAFWRLIFTADNLPYNHSGTAGDTERTPGPIDVAWFYQRFIGNPSELPTKGTFPVMRFYVTASSYWELTWGRIDGIEPFGARKETPENVGATIRGTWSGYVGTSEGTIKDPADSTRWPSA